MKLIVLIFFSCAILLCEDKPLSVEDDTCIVEDLAATINATGKIVTDAFTSPLPECNSIIDARKAEIYEAIRDQMKAANLTNEADCVIKSLKAKYFAEYTLLYYVIRKYDINKKTMREKLLEEKATLDKISEDSLKDCKL